MRCSKGKLLSITAGGRKKNEDNLLFFYTPNHYYIVKIGVYHILWIKSNKLE